MKTLLTKTGTVLLLGTWLVVTLLAKAAFFILYWYVKLFLRLVFVLFVEHARRSPIG